MADVDAAVRPPPSRPARMFHAPRRHRALAPRSRRSTCSRRRGTCCSGACVHPRVLDRGRRLCNPSAVLHPRAGRQRRRRLRAERPRHRRRPPSSHRLPHRDVTAAGTVTIDPPARSRRPPAPSPGAHQHGGVPRQARRARRRLARTPPSCSTPCPTRSTTTISAARIEQLLADGATRRHTATTIANLRRLRRFVLPRRLPRRTPSCPSGCCGPRRRRNGTAWRTPASCGSSTTTAPSPTTPRTPRSTGTPSPSTCWRPTTSLRSPRRRWPAPPPPARAWPSSRARSAAATWRCHAPTARPNAIAFSDDLHSWADVGAAPDPGAIVGDPAARQLRLADRDRRRLAGAHPRRRPDAHLLARRHPARSRRPEPRAGPFERRRSWHRWPDVETATCPTSSTPAAGSPTATCSCSPTASATRPSRWRRCRCGRCSPRSRPEPARSAHAGAVTPTDAAAVTMLVQVSSGSSMPSASRLAFLRRSGSPGASTSSTPTAGRAVFSQSM